MKQNLSKRSSILSLTPLLDSNNIIRVGGRLRHADMPEEMKHPIILPPTGHVTRLIIQHAHLTTCHGSIETTLRAVRNEFWIIRGKKAVRNQLSKCMRCFRFRCRPMEQQMADLRPPQVQQNRPFSHTGVDYAGYFEVKSSTLRRAPYLKCYVALFICLTTKAIHVELVTDLTTAAFLMALRRFCSRRGKPDHMYSDLGTNFIGAANEMPQIFSEIKSAEHLEIMNKPIAKEIKWHFNAARASHFGGLWEAGVKSVKTHLKKTLLNIKVNFEEFSTILTEIEACLNSRPLCPLSNDPEDLAVITPGHFLMGQAINTLPDPSNPLGRASMQMKLQHRQRLIESFWKSWSYEYLSRMQQRPKWKHVQENLKEGQLVMIMEDNLPPTVWALGRILRVFY